MQAANNFVVAPEMRFVVVANEYLIGKVIGSGGFSEVRLGELSRVSHSICCVLS